MSEHCMKHMVKTQTEPLMPGGYGILCPEQSCGFGVISYRLASPNS